MPWNVIHIEQFIVNEMCEYSVVAVCSNVVIGLRVVRPLPYTAIQLMSFAWELLNFTQCKGNKQSDLCKSHNVSTLCFIGCSHVLLLVIQESVHASHPIRSKSSWEITIFDS